jgi:hypothetical protein
MTKKKSAAPSVEFEPVPLGPRSYREAHLVTINGTRESRRKIVVRPGESLVEHMSGWRSVTGRLLVNEDGKVNGLRLTKDEGGRRLCWYRAAGGQRRCRVVFPLRVDGAEIIVAAVGGIGAVNVDGSVVADGSVVLTLPEAIRGNWSKFFKISLKKRH